MKEKIRCVVCKKIIHTTKIDVPRLNTKSYCLKCYCITKEQRKRKPRVNHTGTKFTFKRWKPAWH